ncbi:P-loop containing nucleoside triphosphate hydrolase protein, partial [Amanita rubescens]
MFAAAHSPRHWNRNMHDGIALRSNRSSGQSESLEKSAANTPPSVYLDPMAVDDSSQFRARERQPTGGTSTEPISNHSNRETIFIRNIASVAQRKLATELPVDAGHRITLPSEQSPAVYPKATDDTPNVIIFGETGVGKSSLINMIAGTPSAAISSSAIGCTFESIPYVVELNGLQYRLWDTAGLNEGENGNLSADRAIESLQELVRNLQYGGISLLVYCIRGSRLRDIVKIDYGLFYTIICGAQVPVVVVITGLENEDDMEDWWKDNVQDFNDRGMRFAGHACVTTTNGRVMKDGQHMFEEEYNHSVKLVRELIVLHCPVSSWKPD